MYEYLKELPKEAWLAIGAVGGALLTAFAGLLTSKVQQRIALWQIEKDVHIHREKLQADATAARAGKMLEKLEIAHETLAEVAMAFSITGMYFTREDQSVEEFRAWYLGYCRKVQKLIGTVAFYVPDGAADDVRKLYGCMNVFWGEMEGVIVAHAEGKMEFKEKRRERVFAASKEISELAASVARSLERSAQQAVSSLEKLG